MGDTADPSANIRTGCAAECWKVEAFAKDDAFVKPTGTLDHTGAGGKLVNCDELDIPDFPFLVKDKNLTVFRSLWSEVDSRRAAAAAALRLKLRAAWTGSPGLKPEIMVSYFGPSQHAASRQ